MLAAMQLEPIEDNPGYRTFGRIIEDNNVEAKTIINIHANDEAYREAHVQVVSYNGYLLLAGQVPTEALKARATTIAREVAGVRRIYNELEIAAPSSGMTRTSDTWISAKVKTVLLAREDTDGSRVKVVTENGVVYLLGLVSGAEAKRISTAAADISGVQRVVQLFELID
ncbi:MAG: BON domain-containing protein [Halioglobus sp.]|nr:BON domain-containing protein [Halioglobus sp.]